MKIRPVGAELFRADALTDRHDESNSPFSQILETGLTISSCDKILKKYISEFVEVALPYIRMYMININTAVAT
jgi:hypothetical protein